MMKFGCKYLEELKLSQSLRCRVFEIGAGESMPRARTERGHGGRNWQIRRSGIEQPDPRHTEPPPVHAARRERCGGTDRFSFRMYSDGTSAQPARQATRAGDRGSVAGADRLSSPHARYRGRSGRLVADLLAALVHRP